MLYIRISSQRIIREIFIPPRRSFTHQRPIEDLQQLYDLLKHESMCKRKCSFLLFLFLNNLLFTLASKYPFEKKMNPNGIFANNELDLQKIKVYGFDFGLLFHFNHKT